jgi:RNA polymerase sigma factor (sigma-70 family)
MRKQELRNVEAECGRQMKPWEDGFGRVLSTARLREVSRDWSEETWQEYLETLEGQPDDFLVDNYDDAIRTYTQEDPEEESLPSTDLAAITRGIERLQPMEQTVIRSMFWQGMSEREVAELLGTSRRAVMNIKADALKKLKAQISTNNVRELRPGNVMPLGFSEMVTPHRIAAAQEIYQ